MNESLVRKYCISFDLPDTRIFVIEHIFVENSPNKKKNI